MLGYGDYVMASHSFLAALICLVASLGGCAHEPATCPVAATPPCATASKVTLRGIPSPNHLKRAYWSSSTAKLAVVTGNDGRELARIKALPNADEQLFWPDIDHIGYLKASNDGARVLVMHSVVGNQSPEITPVYDLQWSPQHDCFVFVTRTQAGEALWINGRKIWPRNGYTHLRGDLVWSPNGHSLSFVDLPANGPRLVVLVEFDDANGDLTWPLPKDATQPGLRLFWASESKVVIGESALRPKFAAGWERLD